MPPIISEDFTDVNVCNYKHQVRYDVCSYEHYLVRNLVKPYVREITCTSRSSPASLVADALTISGKPANRMILLGDPKWVKGIIHRLHSLGIAEVGSWSKLTPTRNPGEVISILKRSRGQEKA
jgi:hypothetical protein